MSLSLNVTHEFEFECDPCEFECDPCEFECDQCEFECEPMSLSLNVTHDFILILFDVLRNFKKNSYIISNILRYISPIVRLTNLTGC